MVYNHFRVIKPSKKMKERKDNKFDISIRDKESLKILETTGLF
jgi:hypothetical protein